MAERIDVLAVMDRHIERNIERGAAKGSPSDRELRQARAAVAELMQTSAGALSDLDAMVAAADRGEVWVVNAGTRLRLEALRAALAGGASHGFNREVTP